MNIINVTSRAFLSQQRNGEDFLTNPTTDNTSFYQVDVSEKTKLITTIQVSTIEEASDTSQFFAETVGTQIKITHPFDNWTNAGFGVNNAVRIENSNTASANISEIVENINGNEMFLSDSGFFAALGTVDGDSSPYYVFKVTTVPTALQYKFNTVQNGLAGFDFLSPLTGEEQVYAGNGISGTLTDLNYISSDASKRGTAQAKYNSSSGTGNYIHEFTLEHVFLNLFYVQSWQLAYQLGTIPTPFQGSNSFKYVSEFNFSTNITDPNQGKVFMDDFQNGTAGLYNQNFNLGVVNYELTSISYTVGGIASTGIDVDETTRVILRVKKTNGNFTATELASIYCYKLPTNTEYNAANTLEENFLYNRGFNASGSGASDFDYMTDLTVTRDASDNEYLDILFNLTYSASQKALVNNNDQFFIGCGLEDVGIINYLSDRVTVWADSGKYIKTPDIPDLIDKNQINFYNSQQSAARSTPRSNINTWVNSLQLAEGRFQLAKFTNGQQTRLKSFLVQLVAYDGTKFFKVQDYVFQIPSANLAPVYSGANFQLINLDIDNTLGIPTDDEFNRAKFSCVNPGSYQIFQRFDWSVGFEISWRDWVELQSVQDIAPEFYDNSELFNGFNKRMSNYSAANGFEIYCFATAEIETNEGTTVYQMLSDESYIYDFDVDTVSGWSAEWKYYDESGVETNNIFIGQDITIVCTMTNPGILVTPAVSGAEIVVEVSGSEGRDYRLHSNKDWSETVNLLEGPGGTDFVIHTQESAPNKEILTAVLKKGKIVIGNKYNFMSHLNWDS